ncbi:MAG: hypothetical protein IPP28_04445 [Xanthomonadales bacterium]|nr:hypothetical protein [Xanthomonadales bacterium]
MCRSSRISRALDGHRTQFELRQERPEGPRFLRGSYQPKRDDGAVVGVFGMILDQNRVEAEPKTSCASWPSSTH